MGENNSSFRGYLTAATVGAAVGAAIALLYAPCSGQETRKKLARRAKKLKGQAETAIEDAKEFILQKKEDVEEAVKAGKKMVRDARRD
jgi:gas vesicle protein